MTRDGVHKLGTSVLVIGTIEAMPSSLSPRAPREPERVPAGRHRRGARYGALPQRRSLRWTVPVAVLAAGMAGGFGIACSIPVSAAPTPTLADLGVPVIADRIDAVRAQARAELEANIETARTVLEVSAAAVSVPPHAQEELAAAIAQAEELVARDGVGSLPDAAAAAAGATEEATPSAGESTAADEAAAAEALGDVDPALPQTAEPTTAATTDPEAPATTDPASPAAPATPGAAATSNPATATLAEVRASLAAAERATAVETLSLARASGAERLAQWEPIASDPTRVEELRGTIALADELLAAEDPARADAAAASELVDAASALRTATEALPEVVIAQDGTTWIDGILVANKTIAVPADYNPGLLPQVQQAFDEMRAAAAADGITLWIKSGFRSYADQKIVYGDYAARLGQSAADRFSSRPGHSEHQTGLAIDVNLARPAFAGTAEAAWLAAHAPEFGFVVRFPDGREGATGYTYEPWHLRYVGPELARTLTDADLSIEEFLGITSAYPE